MSKICNKKFLVEFSETFPFIIKGFANLNWVFIEIIKYSVENIDCHFLKSGIVKITKFH